MSGAPLRAVVLLIGLLLLFTGPIRTSAQESRTEARHDSLATDAFELPSNDVLRRTLLLRDYNTRVVVAGTTLLGLAAGVVGSFTLLRKRALMGDALSHATLPGIALAFIAATWLGLEGKSLPILLLGAAVSGTLGMAAVLFIRNGTRLKEDAALGIVLSVFFGAGAALLSMVQQRNEGHAAGLESFIYGKAASMTVEDSWIIGVAGAVSLLVATLLYKELRLLCFDEGFAGSRGYPTTLIDVALMALVVVVTIVGLQAVGLILVIALLIIPAAAARFWTENLFRMTLVSAALGAASGLAGSIASALFARLPSGAMIVLVATAFFAASMVFGPARGTLVRWRRRRRLNLRIDRRHLLRGLYEYKEGQADSKEPSLSSSPVPFADILAMRSWPARRLRAALRRAQREGLVVPAGSGSRTWTLTPEGLREAARLVHEHRLWEIYLIAHADVAPAKVDRDADAIEHVLDGAMIAELEELLERRQAVEGVAVSPHPLSPGAGLSASPGGR
jgi:manganese/zinc/iron transport system permease protein